ncbi:transcriptional regulator [Chryseobacterium indologenes]|nr:transcriptional regulator [Chryseobacterium indologenes]AYY84836.1 XRE family transcriptional regulator [Chryseobacterium indologenes]
MVPSALCTYSDKCRMWRIKIEMTTKLAEALEVSLAYLVGSTDILLDKNIVAKILDIQKLKENHRQHVFALLDAFLKQTKLQSIL